MLGLPIPLGKYLIVVISAIIVCGTFVDNLIYIELLSSHALVWTIYTVYGLF